MVDAPDHAGPTIDALDEIDGVPILLTDLFYWGTDRQPTDHIEGAIVVGPGRIHGQDCTHYAYRQAEIDWQLCITDGEQRLPLKRVITITNLPEQPEYIAWIRWVGLDGRHRPRRFHLRPTRRRRQDPVHPVDRRPVRKAAMNKTRITHQQCGSTWYQPRYAGSSVTYVVVNPPR